MIALAGRELSHYQLPGIALPVRVVVLMSFRLIQLGEHKFFTLSPPSAVLT
ncbi:hypothetical protein GI374_15605 [Paracoccus sp. S-4012]|uniref:hypothetical protein n=1 Tax=Paracoccus sp. S-4012 TaxID=2665648 RepID=UPI0012AF3EC7|nr:hypothetical protein [Paracoccus sp. S-4012]MRX51823.1 hypothetical protein [Paracoccus sp. S-4012]